MPLLPALVCACLASFADPVARDDGFAFPETPVGVCAAAWFEAYAAGDEALLAFEGEHRAPDTLDDFPIARWMEFYGRVRGLAGALTPLEVVSGDAARLVLVAAAERTERRIELRFQCDRAAPHALRALSITTRADDAGPAAPRVHTGWKDLAELLERVRADLRLPGLAAAVLEDGALAAHAAVGLRKQGGREAVAVGDRFHIGSVTKSVTATVVARLIEQERLRWDMLLADALPGVDMHVAYAERTLRELLAHRAGLPADLNFDDDELTRLAGLPGAADEQRRAYLLEVLATEPQTGGAFLYSNAGYSLAGHIAEVAAEQPWEQLVQRHVFAPLGMKSSGFGWPRSAARKQPWGHHGEPGALVPQIDGEYELGHFLAPAGGAHASVADLARYALAHLAGLRGEDGILKAETVRALHQPPPASVGGTAYAGGWIVERGDASGAGERHWHNGSAGTFYAYVELRPAENAGLVVLINAPDFANSAAQSIAASLAARPVEASAR